MFGMSTGVLFAGDGMIVAVHGLLDWVYVD
jgi:hypothetical protein